MIWHLPNVDNKFLEHYYEYVVLPQYGSDLDLKTLTWKDHGKIDLDAWAHYFEDSDGREYVLLYEDFPGSTYLTDGLTHEVVRVNGQTSLELLFSDGNKKIDNLVGYFTLYREKGQNK